MSSYYRERRDAGEFAAPAQPDDLEEMSKPDLLAYARRLGVSPANNDMTKDELRDAIQAHQAGG